MGEEERRRLFMVVDDGKKIRLNNGNIKKNMLCVAIFIYLSINNSRFCFLRAKLVQGWVCYCHE